MDTLDLPSARIHPQTLARHGEGCEGADRIEIDGVDYRIVLSEAVDVGAVLCEDGRSEVEFWLEGAVN